MFISFEGLDGSGKTTITQKLVAKLNEMHPGLNALWTREPGGRDIREAEKIREIILDKASELSPVAEALLYTTSRRIHLEKVIWPALERKQIVICDRYVDSFYAYQGYARELGIEFVKAITNIVINNTMPDITVFLNLTPEQSKQRRESTRLVEDRMEQEKVEFHNLVYKGYWTLIKEDAKRFMIIDAMQSEEEVLQDIINQLHQHPKFLAYLEKHYAK
ncbi:dTMP kinase [Mycoplasmopsis verecunda]|uniref:Thymidylate kinase n=1 Tax=Mycoplasmopsis verecunda TaxID=171291 RepID=A0A1T4L0T2_9BACT|nr:dTMP kinase [Mycoplasmopsis verecunda]WPB54401.1 dTMP kinase [Mycoplasmopsis verecunda]SJZ48208.1 dTMP kinase [Mycoplasmopsis verecunda]